MLFQKFSHIFKKNLKSYNLRNTPCIIDRKAIKLFLTYFFNLSILSLLSCDSITPPLDAPAEFQFSPVQAVCGSKMEGQKLYKKCKKLNYVL